MAKSDSTPQVTMTKENPRSLVLAVEQGMSDSRRCAGVLAAITIDVLSQRITPQIGNTACNAIGKLMKVKEMEIKYGVADTDGGPKRLALTD